MKCRYEDCTEHHPIASEEEQITCPTCRQTLGLDALPVNLRLEQEALDGNLESARELAFFERFNEYTTNLDACPAAAEEYEKARAHWLEHRFDNDADDDAREQA